MPIQQPLLYNQALILAKIEAVSRVDQIAADTVDVVKLTHAFLVENPQIEPDVQKLDRNNVRVDLSPEASRAGRKLGRISFLKEINGSGSAAVEPRTGTLLRACAMSQLQRTTAAFSTVRFDNIFQTNKAVGSTAKLTGAAGTAAYTGSVFRSAIIECTLGGASGVATVKVDIKERDGTSHHSATGLVVTTAQELVIGAVADGSPSFTVTFTGSMVAGDKWQVDLLPAGFYYNPVSGSFQSLTLYCYYGAGSTTILHKLVGAMGTFSVSGDAAQYGKYAFTFTGDWNTPTTVTMPTGVEYGDVVPPIVELADIYLADHGGANPYDCSNGLLCNSFQVDIANRLALRNSICAPSGYIGSFVGGRGPTAGIDPETVVESVHPFWGALESAALKHFYCRIGTVAGNRVAFYAPNAQYAGLGYGDRDSLRHYALALNLARVNGNDELEIAYT